MRTKESIKNISVSLLSQIIVILLGFISRKVFLDSLGSEYLGINGLMTNVLSMLGLVESGIGVSIVYNLYKPLAEKDEKKVISLIQLYKKTYIILALIVLAVSICIYPIMIKITKSDISYQYITIVYFIFVFKNILSYLYAHKWSLINADQKGYVLARINIIFTIVTLGVRIIILNITKSYILYLSIEIIIIMIQNVFNSHVVDKYYPYIKSKEKIELDKATKDNIVKNVKALFLHNIGGYCVNGTDNILISIFINLKTVGLYSNYTMVIGQLGNLVTPILGGINASVGNLIATESKDKSYEVFKVTYLVNFWIYSFCVIFLFNLLEPFINWWIGIGFLIDKLTFVVVLVNFYITGMRISISTFKNKAGIFVQDKYMPLIEAVINLGTSILLVRYFGLAGIFMGTTISTLCIVFWNVPRLVYKNVFNKPLKEYFIRYIKYIVITLIIGYITTILCNSVVCKSLFISLIIKGIICVITVNLSYIIIFFKSVELNYIINIIKSLLINGKKTRINISV